METSHTCQVLFVCLFVSELRNVQEQGRVQLRPVSALRRDGFSSRPPPHPCSPPPPPPPSGVWSVLTSPPQVSAPCSPPPPLPTLRCLLRAHLPPPHPQVSAPCSPPPPPSGVCSVLTSPSPPQVFAPCSPPPPPPRCLLRAHLPLPPLRCLLRAHLPLPPLRCLLRAHPPYPLRCLLRAHLPPSPPPFCVLTKGKSPKICVLCVRVKISIQLNTCVLGSSIRLVKCGSKLTTILK